MQAAASKAGVQLVTGDTKVVDKGKGDGIFVNTAGIGLIESNVTGTIGPASVQVGDAVIVSGDLGGHGVAISFRARGSRVRIADLERHRCGPGQQLRRC
jgi:hydrogenase expression/formation protein HypE